MKQAIVGMICCAVICVLTSCGGGIQEIESMPFSHPEASEENPFQYTGVKIEGAAPKGVLCRENDIIAVDYEENRLIRYDLDGNLIEYIGGLGMGEKEFNSPMTVTEHDEKIYVLDSGNDRIQILDSSLNFLDEVKLVVVSDLYTYNDIAVSDEYIAVSTDSIGKIKPHILVYDHNKNLLHENYDFFGFLTEYDNKIYAVNSHQIFTHYSDVTARVGYNYLYEVDAAGLRQLCELPFKYSPSDFIIDDETIYAVSKPYAEIGAFDMNGVYKYMAVDFPDGSLFSCYIDMDKNGCFWVSSDGGLFLYKKQENNSE